MTFAKSLYADLMEKRLWPLALALLVGLIALPVVLGNHGSEKSVEIAPPSGAAGSGAGAVLGETRPVVSVETTERLRKNLARLQRKNPFVQQARPKAKSTESLVTPPPLGTNPISGEAPVTSGPLGNSYAGPPATSPSQPSYTATVEFGELGNTDTKTLLPTRPLPSTDNPVIVFMGASSAGDEAVFLVSSDATAHGDGKCKPSNDNCNYLYMKEGDVEFIEVAGAGDTVTTYQLELKNLGTKTASQSPTTSSQHELGLKRTLPSASSRRAKRAREALRAKKIYRALYLLGL